MSDYRVTIQDPDDGFDEVFYEDTEDDAYNRGLDEIQLCSGFHAVFIVEEYSFEDDEAIREIGTYDRDGEPIW